MKTATVQVQKEFCAECSLALMRFIGKLKGVDSITADGGNVVLSYDESAITEEDLLRITRESIDKLGYRIIDNEPEQ